MDPFSLSWKMGPPPSRKDILMLSDTSMPAGVDLTELSALGPGDWGRRDCDEDLGPVGVPLRESKGAPHISHDSSEGWLENVHLGH